MGLKQRIKSLLGIDDATNQLGNLFNKALYSYNNGYYFGLPYNKETYIKEGYQKNLDLYSVVRLISSKVGDAKFYACTIKDGKEVQVDSTQTIAKILKRPNENSRQQGFLEEETIMLLLTGDIYLYKLRFQTGADKGKVNKLYVLPSQYMQIVGGGWENPIEYYKMIIGNQMVRFEKEDIIHFKYYNPNFGVAGEQLYGQSPVMAGLKTIDSSNEAHSYKANSFHNGGVHGLISSKDPNNVASIETLSQLNDLIKARITGTKNAQKISATEAAVDYTQIGMSPADLEVIKSINADANSICKLYGVDPAIFDTDSSTYSNKQEAYKALVNNVVTPILNIIQELLNEALEDYGYEIKYDISHFPELQKDLKAMVESLDKAWWLTPNQKLVKMGEAENEDPLMNRIYIPSNLVPLEEIDINIPLDNE